MMLQTVSGASFVVQLLITPVSLDIPPPLASYLMAPPQISVRQRDTALLPLVRRATDCIVHAVKADPRYDDAVRPGDLNDLIVDAMPQCAPVLRVMIDMHDSMYGRGSGEAFLMGPYLDVLPGALAQQVRLKPAAR